MPIATTNGIDVCYEEGGAPDASALLLVMGFTAQLIAWPDTFVDGLVERGFRVIRFDNRDCGLSTKLTGRQVDLAALLTGQVTDIPYTLSDMAADAIGLLDHLGIDRAHIVGASMGGMIAQTIAVEHPDRVLSLCSIMSTTGGRDVGQPTAAALAALLTAPPATREEAIERGIEAGRIIGSPAYPMDKAVERERAGRTYDRSFYPEGATRQLAAILTQPDRAVALGAVSVPTLIVHGTDDPLVTVSGGHATAKAIPSSELLEIAGMGHDLPEALVDQIADAVARNAARPGQESTRNEETTQLVSGMRRT